MSTRTIIPSRQQAHTTSEGFTLPNIIDTLDLKRPIYCQTAAYGHFGRTDIDLPWEHLDKVEELKALLK